MLGLVNNVLVEKHILHFKKNYYGGLVVNLVIIVTFNLKLNSLSCLTYFICISNKFY